MTTTPSLAMSLPTSNRKMQGVLRAYSTVYAGLIIATLDTFRVSWSNLNSTLFFHVLFLAALVYKFAFPDRLRHVIHCYKHSELEKWEGPIFVVLSLFFHERILGILLYSILLLVQARRVPVVVTVNGIIGAGKNSFCHSLQHELERKANLNVLYIPEPVNDEMLKEFTREKEKAAYSFQLYVLKHRILVINQALLHLPWNTTPDVIVLERDPLSDTIFAKIQYEHSKWFTKMQWEQYKDAFLADTAQLSILPSHYIYIDTEVETAIDRVHKRNRASELPEGNEKPMITEGYQSLLRQNHLRVFGSEFFSSSNPGDDEFQYKKNPTIVIKPDLAGLDFRGETETLKEETDGTRQARRMIIEPVCEYLESEAIGMNLRTSLVGGFLLILAYLYVGVEWNTPVGVAIMMSLFHLKSSKLQGLVMIYVVERFFGSGLALLVMHELFL